MHHPAVSPRTRIVAASGRLLPMLAGIEEKFRSAKALKPRNRNVFEINETHDAALTSWVPSANDPGDFPIQNLPFGVFRRKGQNEAFRVGVAIGDQILDISAAQTAGVFSGPAARSAAACSAPSLNAFMAMGPAAWSSLRFALSQILRHNSPLADRLHGCLVAQNHAEHALPAHIGDY